MVHMYTYIPQPPPSLSSRRWFSFRFNNGTNLAFHHWIVPPDNQPVHHRNHYCRMHPDGKVEYGYPSTEMRFTPVKAWKVDGLDEQWDMEVSLVCVWSGVDWAGLD